MIFRCLHVHTVSVSNFFLSILFVVIIRKSFAFEVKGKVVLFKAPCFRCLFNRPWGRKISLGLELEFSVFWVVKKPSAQLTTNVI